MIDKNHPNLNVSALMLDVMNAIHKRRSGKAGQATDKEIHELLTPTVTRFVEELSGILDLHYPE